MDLFQRSWSIKTSVGRGEQVLEEVEGLAQWGDEQLILGSDNPFLEEPNDSYPDPDETKSYFMLKRIDAQTTCQQIIEQKDQLFVQKYIKMF